MMEQPPKLIFSQGEMDGACFLYSLANAAVALGVSRKQVIEQWPTGVNNLFDARGFLDCTKGTGESNAAEDVGLAEQFLNALAPDQFAVKSLNPRYPLLESAREHLSTQSILVIDDEDHWFCIVDISGGTLHAACSSRWNEMKAYAEWRTATRLKLNRLANVKLTPRQIPSELRRILRISHR